MTEAVENNQKVTPKKLGGATGKGFLPGKSGNPGGRTPLPEELKRMYQAEAGPALKVAKELRDDKKQPGAVRIRACEYITDRGYGKPTQPTELSFTDVPDADLIERAKSVLAGIGSPGTADG